MFGHALGILFFAVLASLRPYFGWLSQQSAMEFRDYYAIMGVSKTASQDEIKRAYRKLARKYHPDVSKEPDAEARFKEVGEAYEVLKDPEKRAAYDQLGSNWKAGQDFRPPPDWDAGFEFTGGGGPENADTYSDFFEAIFGMRDGGRFHQAAGGRGSARSQHGEDHHAKITIDLEDSFRGSTQAFTLRAPEIDAQGRVALRERTLNVKIPKGIKPGQHIRLTGQGSPGIGGGPSGDLYLEVAFKPHALFNVDGQDLYLELPLAPWEAVLGAKVKAPTPTGNIEVTIPADSKSGGKLRFKGRGIPGTPPGDLYAILRIALPPADSDRAKALYREMERDLAFNPRASLGA